MSGANPFVGVNFIPDNPRMEVPPAFFLQRIYDQDAMLVMLPSRKRPFAYVMARRLQRSLGLTPGAIDAQVTDSDTRMCLKYKLVPVCMVFKHGSTWNPDVIIQKLRARDMWAHGGGDAVADLLDAQDAAEEAANKAAIRDDMWNRSGDAWRSYQARTGQRVVASSPAANGAADVIAPSGSTAGLGQGQ